MNGIKLAESQLPTSKPTVKPRLPGDYLDGLNRLPTWKVRKLDPFQIANYLGALRETRADIESQLFWIEGWERIFEEELGTRKAAADEIERRRRKDAAQAQALKERNAALERQYLSDQYAE